VVGLTSIYWKREWSQEAVPRILDVGDGGDDVIADTKNEISSNISAVDVTIEWDMDSSL
jgi:hypothetical protein